MAETTITITYDCPFRGICSDNGVKCGICANNPQRSYYRPIEPPYYPYPTYPTPYYPVPYIPYSPPSYSPWYTTGGV